MGQTRYTEFRTLPKACTGAVTLIQRFGSSLNLNLHFHMLLLDGVYVTGHERLRFKRLKAPTKAELDILIRQLLHALLYLLHLTSRDGGNAKGL